jgi:hypothetical protein
MVRRKRRGWLYSSKIWGWTFAVKIQEIHHWTAPVGWMYSSRMIIVSRKLRKINLLQASFCRPQGIRKKINSVWWPHELHLPSKRRFRLLHQPCWHRHRNKVRLFFFYQESWTNRPFCQRDVEFFCDAVNLFRCHPTEAEHSDLHIDTYHLFRYITIKWLIIMQCCELSSNAKRNNFEQNEVEGEENMFEGDPSYGVLLPSYRHEHSSTT